MTQPPPALTQRFKTAASYYLSGRPAYAPALVRRVAQSCSLDGAARLLDLGCGPGQLAVAFSTWVGHALALDPEPAMLDIAAQLGAGIAPNVEYRQGSSRDLDAGLGRFRIAVIGRAFHWMDRAETLTRLDRLIEPQGAVVLFGTRQLTHPDTPWLDDYRALIERYADDDPARQQRKSPDWESHDTVLLRSPFASLERISIIEERRLDVERLKARPLSMSSLSRERLGERLDELLAAVDALIARHATQGALPERIESTALIARR